MQSSVDVRALRQELVTDIDSIRYGYSAPPPAFRQAKTAPRIDSKDGIVDRQREQIVPQPPVAESRGPTTKWKVKQIIPPATPEMAPQ